MSNVPLLTPACVESSQNSIYQEGKLDEAGREYRSVLSISADDPWALEGLAKVKAEQGYLSEARDAAEELLRKDPEHHDAHGLLGRICAVQGDLDVAQRELMRTIGLSPETAENHLVLAEILAERAQFHESEVNSTDASYLWYEAEAYYRRAITLAPDDARAHLELSVALERQNKLDEALQEAKLCCVIGPRWTICSGSSSGTSC